MEVAASIVDFGTAPEISVDGIARIEQISANKIRVSYYSRHKMWCGKIENRIVAHVDWDKDVWLATFDTFAAAMNDIRNGREITPATDIAAGAQAH